MLSKFTSLIKNIISLIKYRLLPLHTRLHFFILSFREPSTNNVKKNQKGLGDEEDKASKKPFQVNFPIRMVGPLRRALTAIEASMRPEDAC